MIGPTHQGHEASDDTDIEAIREIRAAIEEAENRKDARAFGSFFADDVAMLPPGNRIDGADEVEEFHRLLYERFRDLRVSFEIERIEVLGDLAVEVGTYIATSVRHDGTADQSGGRYVYAYERQPTGTWKIHRMSWG